MRAGWSPGGEGLLLNNSSYCSKFNLVRCNLTSDPCSYHVSHQGCFALINNFEHSIHEWYHIFLLNVFIIFFLWYYFLVYNLLKIAGPELMFTKLLWLLIFL